METVRLKVLVIDLIIIAYICIRLYVENYKIVWVWAFQRSPNLSLQFTYPRPAAGKGLTGGAFQPESGLQPDPNTLPVPSSSEALRGFSTFFWKTSDVSFFIASSKQLCRVDFVPFCFCLSYAWPHFEWVLALMIVSGPYSAPWCAGHFVKVNSTFWKVASLLGSGEWHCTKTPYAL